MVLVISAYSTHGLHTQPRVPSEWDPARRLQDQEIVYVTASPYSEFDLLCQHTYGTLDWIILIGCVVIGMCLCLSCGWMSHIWWTRDEYDPRLSVNCREMADNKPSSIVISPSLSDKVRTKLEFAGGKLRGLKDRYANNRSSETQSPLDLELAQSQVYAQGQRYSMGFGPGRPQTPGAEMERAVLQVQYSLRRDNEIGRQAPILLDLSGSMGDDSRTHDTPTATGTAADTRDTPQPSSTGTGLYRSTADKKGGKDGIRELTIASTEERWTRASNTTGSKRITPRSEQTGDRAERFSTPL